MDRRTFVRRSAAAGVALAAGCSGAGGGDPDGSADLEVEGNDVEYGPTDGGSFRVRVPITNEADDARSETFVLTVKVGGETYEKRTDVEVPGGETKTYEIVFEDVDGDASGEKTLSWEFA